MLQPLMSKQDAETTLCRNHTLAAMGSHRTSAPLSSSPLPGIPVRTCNAVDIPQASSSALRMQFQAERPNDFKDRFEVGASLAR